MDTTNQDDRQLPLPFKESANMRSASRNDSSTVIDITHRIKENAKAKQIDSRMRIIKMLVDYANSLDW